MKRLIYLVIPAIALISCNSGEKKAATTTKTDSTGKVTYVTVADIQPTIFNAYVQVQGAVNSDENVMASPQSPGIVRNILVHVGQHVSQGQLLATLDASTVERNIEAQQPQINFLKDLYEKQQKLWAQNIGTEVQLMQAKANYESALKQVEVVKAQRDLFRIVAPVSGTVDALNIKIGDQVAPGMSGIRIVNYDKLKAESQIGENYLGEVKEGDPTMLIFPDVNDSIKSSLTYVSQAVDPMSRAITVQVKLPNSSKLHPNMSCVMKIAYYQNPKALVIPVSAIQKTPNGDMVYVADGNKAKAVIIKEGQNSNGLVEVTDGLNPGDQVITQGFEDLNNGDAVSIQK